MKLKKLKAMKNKPVNIVISARHSGKNQNLPFSIFLDMKDTIIHLNKKLAIIEKNIIEFINELAWFDAQYDAMQSTMGDMPASRSAIPKYAKRYFNLWKELFNENLGQAKEENKND